MGDTTKKTETLTQETTEVEQTTEQNSAEVEAEGNPTPANTPAKKPEVKPDGQEEKKDSQEPAEITAESYGDFELGGLKPAEETLGEFKQVAAELKLPKEAAQKLIDLQVKLEQANIAAYDKTAKGWDLENEKTYGKDNWPKEEAKIIKALDNLDPEGKAKEVLVTTKVIKHPAVVRLLLEVAKSTSEESLKEGTPGGSTEKKRAADVMFPNMKKRSN